MRRWFFQDGTKVKELDEERLRKKLVSGDLTGLELAHPEGDLAWRPLHDWPVFAEVVPFTGSSREAAVERARHSFFWHAASFVGVIGFLTLQSGGVPGWSIFWLMGLAGHAFKALPALRPQLAQPPSPVPLTPPAPVSLQEVSPGGFLAQVEAVLDELARTGGTRVDRGALREGAQALQTTLDGLAEAAEPEAGSRLQLDLADAEERVHAAPDEATAEIFQDEAQAIVARLDAWQDAATAVSRIQARQRTLLHQLHALRLDLARDEAPAAGLDPVQAQVAQLRQEAIAAAEIDQDLARARRAQKGT
jgi:hypothetical protein